MGATNIYVGEEVAAAMTPHEACLESTRHGLQLYLQGQYTEALQAFDGALALDDTICLTWIGKGKALLELQRYPEAQAAFEHALAFDPTSSEALRGKAQALAHGEPCDEKGWGLVPDLDGAELAPLVEFLISLAIHH